jgi:hypothetical protein
MHDLKRHAYIVRYVSKDIYTLTDICTHLCAVVAMSRGLKGFARVFKGLITELVAKDECIRRG